jgi:nucleotide-binding universal stress UspA family protein
MIRKILVATDGSVGAVRAARYAIELAKIVGAEIIVLHVVSGYKDATLLGVPHTLLEDVSLIVGHHDEKKDEVLLRQAQGKGLDYVQEVVEMADSVGVKAESKCCVLGDPALQIVNSAKEENSDLIVVGFSGTSGTKNALGRVSDRVIRNTPCPILVVR